MRHLVRGKGNKTFGLEGEETQRHGTLKKGKRNKVGKERKARVNQRIQRMNTERETGSRMGEKDNPKEGKESSEFGTRKVSLLPSKFLILFPLLFFLSSISLFFFPSLEFLSFYYFNLSKEKL